MALQAVAPVGCAVIWLTATPPAGWLILDGSAVSRTTYATLFALWGVTFGVGDGSTTFNLPDFRGRFVFSKAASGTGSTLGGTFGVIDHVHSADPPSTVTGGPSATSAQLVGVINVASETHTHTVDIAAFDTGPANPPGFTVHIIARAL